MESKSKFRTVLICPKAEFGSEERLHQMANVELAPVFSTRLFELPVVAIVVDREGSPVWEPTLFLADTAMRSRSLTGDTARTYSEALLPWLCYLSARDIPFNQVTEEILGVYRAKISHTTQDGRGKRYASATINQRVVVPAIFHAWGQRSGAMQSPLGS
jgi:hypothetical protein